MAHDMLDAVDAMTGAQALVRMLVAAGVDSVFGLASGKLGPLLKAIEAEPAIAFVGVRHEASAAMMATGHAAASARLAVCLGETGPGGLNLLSGLGGAAANGLPVLAITSSNPLDLILPHRGAFSSTDNVALFRPLVKYSERAHRAHRLPELAAAAIRAAMSGARGPVHLDIPADVLGEVSRFRARTFDAGPSLDGGFAPAASAKAIAAAVELLRGARRPLLVGGGGMVAADGHAALRVLAETLDAPVVVTQMGLGLLPSDDPHLVGHGGAIGSPAVARAFAEADVVLAIGCRFSSWMWPAGPPRRGDAAPKLIQIDIGPARIGAALPVAIGIVADGREAVEALVEAFGDHHPARDGDWLDRLQAVHREHRAALDRLASAPAPADAALHPASVARAIGEYVGTSGRVVFDGGHTTFWSNDFTPVALPRTRFHEPGMSHLGFGLPWAIAIKRLYPDEEVICITGDGAFGFTVQELDTARREGLAITVVIHDNAAFGVIGFAQGKAGFALGTDLSGTDYAAIARGFGCRGERIDTLADLAPALARARAARTPAVLDVTTRFEAHPMIATFARSTSAPSHDD